MIKNSVHSAINTFYSRLDMKEIKRYFCHLVVAVKRDIPCKPLDRVNMFYSNIKHIVYIFAIFNGMENKEIKIDSNTMFHCIIIVLLETFLFFSLFNIILCQN